MKIVIIPGLTLPQVPEADIRKIKSLAGHNGEVIVTPHKDAIHHVGDAEIILGLVNEALFSAARQLRWVQSISSGVDMFFYPDFINSDVVLTSEKGLVGEHLADHGFGLLLMLTRQLATALRYGADSWNHRPEMRFQEIELTGAVFGILGLGGTGRAMAKRAAAFGMSCIAVDRDPVQPLAEVTEVWRTNRLHELLSCSDVVSVCCPLTSETRDLLDASAFAAMKDDAILMNVTRGEVMHEASLVSALQHGQIRGAALDVAPREPLPADSPLWSMPNVVMTPHTAGASQFRVRRNIDRFIRNLKAYTTGGKLEGVIDKVAGY